MSDDHGIDKDVDSDYIDVEKRRARVSTTEAEEEPTLDRDAYADGGADMSPHGDMSHRFDAGDGSGAASSLEELIDDNAIIENDGRSKTRTFFYPAEADDEQRYSRIIRWQDGEGDPDRDVENRAADRRRAVDTFCGVLDMSGYHKGRVKYVIEDLNMSHMAHYSSPKVILAVISLVANEDGRFIRDEAAFRALMEDVDTSLHELKKVRTLARKKTERL